MFAFGGYKNLATVTCLTRMVPFSGIHLLTYLLVCQILLTNKETSNYDLPHISLLTGHPNYAYPFRIGWLIIDNLTKIKKCDYKMICTGNNNAQSNTP